MAFSPRWGRALAQLDLDFQIRIPFVSQIVLSVRRAAKNFSSFTNCDKKGDHSGFTVVSVRLLNFLNGMRYGA